MEVRWFGSRSCGLGIQVGVSNPNGWKMRGSEEGPPGQPLAVQGLYGVALPGL